MRTDFVGICKRGCNCQVRMKDWIENALSYHCRSDIISSFQFVLILF